MSMPRERNKLHGNCLILEMHIIFLVTQIKQSRCRNVESHGHNILIY